MLGDSIRTRSGYEHEAEDESGSSWMERGLWIVLLVLAIIWGVDERRQKQQLVTHYVEYRESVEREIAVLQREAAGVHAALQRCEAPSGRLESALRGVMQVLQAGQSLSFF